MVVSPAHALHLVHRINAKSAPGIFEKCRQGLDPGQLWLKRTVLEMGGKDCIVVDETADIDAAAEGESSPPRSASRARSAPPARRLIVHRGRLTTNVLAKRVVERAKKITVGDTTK